MQPTFLKLDELLEIHRDQITRYGGSPEVRDYGLLASAAGMPEAEFGGRRMHADLFDMAAAYLFHIVQNHPFVDGNKRVGAAAAIVFLEMNDVEVQADIDGLFDLTLGVAQGTVDKRQIAAFFRDRSREL